MILIPNDLYNIITSMKINNVIEELEIPGFDLVIEQPKDKDLVQL